MKFFDMLLCRILLTVNTLCTCNDLISFGIVEGYDIALEKCKTSEFTSCISTAESDVECRRVRCCVSLFDEENAF